MTTAALRIAIAGAAGRMGLALAREVAKREDIVLVGASERPGGGRIGADPFTLAGETRAGPAIVDDPAIASATAEVLIDFTTPPATLAALPRLPCPSAVIGTTGFDAEGELRLRAASERLAIVRSGNFSLGINLLAALVRQAAAALGPEWDIEILEMHHRHKVDAPSGTALLLGDAAAAGRGRPLADLRAAPRERTPGPRAEGEIGFAVLRGGGVIGAHEVLFAAEGETVRFAHEAHDRALFARGALAAARWVRGKPPGLYGMADVLGL